MRNRDIEETTGRFLLLFLYSLYTVLFLLGCKIMLGIRFPYIDPYLTQIVNAIERFADYSAKFLGNIF